MYESSSDVLVAYFVMWFLVGGGLGAVIGSTKGRAGTGFVWGALLGFIGWIIVAVMDPTPEKVAENQMRYAGTYSAGGYSAMGIAPAQPNRPQQWGPDPYGRHGHRLFDGYTWTASVADAGRESLDDPGYPVPSLSGEGWAPDPFGRFPQRFHSAGQWTNHVARDGTTYSDQASYPPPSDLPPIHPL